MTNENTPAEAVAGAALAVSMHIVHVLADKGLIAPSVIDEISEGVWDAMAGAPAPLRDLMELRLSAPLAGAKALAALRSDIAK